MHRIFIGALLTLPLPALAGANPEAVYRTLITGTWATTPAACGSAPAFSCAESKVRIGDEVCHFDRPLTGRKGLGVALNLTCPLPEDPAQMSEETLQLTLDQVDVGLPDPGDVLTLEDAGFPVRLLRCPAPLGG